MDNFGQFLEIRVKKESAIGKLLYLCTVKQ